MSVTHVPKRDETWKDRLGLGSRSAPEFYESASTVADTPHALAIRTALDELGLSAIFCVQGVPTIAILNMTSFDPARVVDLHGALWNQGLASLLLVTAGDVLRVYSLARKPQKEWGENFDRRCLIETLNAASQALEIRDLVYGAESGRLWKEHADYFQTKERIDQVLLDNLTQSHKLLGGSLPSDAAQALLIQAMFIAYLEDRKIITPEYVLSATNKAADSFAALLAKRDVKLLKLLFATLRDDFNGDLFVAPCSFDQRAKAPTVNASHLDVIASFRAGREEMTKGYYRFWGYDFRYIPIELVSAVYDRFLGEKEEDRKAQGAYYTPMYLADTVVSQLWDVLPPEVKDKGQFLDPACGSGVFLVRSFQRLCEHWRVKHQSKKIRWPSLLAILRRIHGWDLNGGAVRVAVFSLYVALLEEVDPPDLQALIKNKKILPELWEGTLVQRDFFDALEKEGTSFDVVVGNPPWTSRRGPDRSSVHWCRKNSLPMPDREDAWAFVWKALRHLKSDGQVAFLLPAMGFLHNIADTSLAARKLFMGRSRVLRIINFADLRFQLFDSAIRPTALFLFGPNSVENAEYRFEYWAPKADLNLQIKRTITLSSADRVIMNSATAASDVLAFKHRLWMREPDAKLFAYLSTLPKLSALVKEYKEFSRRRLSAAGHWVIGVGYKPYHDVDDERSTVDHSTSKFVGILPDLPIDSFTSVSQVTTGLRPAASKLVHRKGFEEAFRGARILVPRTISLGRLRASYTEADLTFQDIILGITVPDGEKERGKLLVALLNSKIAAWYSFHGTASFGSERPEVKQSGVVQLPFPALHDLPEPERAQVAAANLVALVNREITKANAPLVLDSGQDSLLSEIDKWAYEYFCLSQDEIVLIEDMIECIIPAVQPHQGSFPELWKAPTEKERQQYATWLINSTAEWLQPDTPLHASLEASNADLGVLRLSFSDSTKSSAYAEKDAILVSDALSKIMQHVRQPIAGNFQLMPDLRLFIDKDLYLVKPMQRRFWLRSTALADSDAIAGDLQHAIDVDARRASVG
ncbi:N-6 DNA methylase [Methylosinus sp. LW3]|uniref:HsdM family class I SAM-dependent methyltransferase n=1 Tax=Methylosinus sp. LW3 TaxID=107635 RepID=UPI000463E8EB|nr:N-6 DNA methylase [Methylosinus sp. LW3]